jgi:hypothetical protein
MNFAVPSFCRLPAVRSGEEMGRPFEVVKWKTMAGKTMKMMVGKMMVGKMMVGKMMVGKMMAK